MSGKLSSRDAWMCESQNGDETFTLVKGMGCAMAENGESLCPESKSLAVSW